ncbi:NAD(P)(+) transhydrogenase (Re/Si-specific) subunit beta [Pseudomonas aeruginosa]|nr:NAD(P)(+) transhydrogenase (Re/Si-specific) subunit beta [Pseudomonas aeruginosa]
MSMNLVTLLYLIASVCFIQALKGLSHPTTSRRGNLFGMVGMAIAVATTVGLVFKLGAEIATTGVGYIVVGLLVGGTAGSIMAKRVEMTKMPELVAFMHSMIGLAAVFIAIAAVVEPQSLGIVAHLGDTIPTGNRLELFLGAAIGAITFSGSVIAFGKLSGKYKFRLFQGTPVQFSGQHLLNLVLGLATLGLGLVFMFTGNLTAFAVMLALAFVLGVLIIIPTHAGGPAGSKEQRPVKSGSADDASFLLTNADSVIIVPGYGLAVARAQHALMELAEKLTHRGVTVKFAIHPVAGRMPGHMNVLLAEAEVPYEQVFEMEDINSEFGQTDVVLVLGANDVVNPAAKNDPKSPIAGMPILEAYKAKTVIVNKRSMASGYAGLDNELFYLDKTMMVFGDAKKVIEDMVKAVE